MNSFNTDEDTEKVIRKYKGFQVQIHTFNQSCFPRVSRDSLLPVAKNFDVAADIDAWYPPGHGDFYESFQNSGLLRQFIAEGREYCFLSNIDNLGATVDLSILNKLLGEKHVDGKPIDFVMEVTDKTRADVKGGTLIQYENKLRLLEIAQVPNEHVEDFKSVKNIQILQHQQYLGEIELRRESVKRTHIKYGNYYQSQNIGKWFACYSIGNGCGRRHEMLRRCHWHQCAQISFFASEKDIRSVAGHVQFV